MCNVFSYTSTDIMIYNHTFDLSQQQIGLQGGVLLKVVNVNAAYAKVVSFHSA